MDKIPGVLFHTLKGKNGWSHLSLSKIDVARVVNVRWTERLWKIFDKDCPYTLNIEYYLPQTKTSIAPTFGSGRTGYTVYNETVLNHSITKRYKTKEDVEREIAELERKMKKLDRYQQQISVEISKFSPE